MGAELWKTFHDLKYVYCLIKNDTGCKPVCALGLMSWFTVLFSSLQMTKGFDPSTNELEDDCKMCATHDSRS